MHKEDAKTADRTTTTLLERFLPCLFYKLSGGVNKHKGSKYSSRKRNYAKISHNVTGLTRQIEAMMTGRVCSPVWLRVTLRMVSNGGSTLNDLITERSYSCLRAS